MQLEQRQCRKWLTGFLVAEIFLGKLKEKISVKNFFSDYTNVSMLSTNVKMCYAVLSYTNVVFFPCMSWSTTLSIFNVFFIFIFGAELGGMVCTL